MPHGLLGLGWGEVVSIVTLVTVVATFFKTYVSGAIHDSNRKDFDDLKSQLFDFKMSVSRLTELLNRLNKDLDTLTKRVNSHGEEIDQLKIKIARIEEHLGDNDNDNDN